jgi:hypothetical protein
LAQHGFTFPVKRVQSARQHVYLSVPHGFGIEHKAVHKHIPAQIQRLLKIRLQNLAESRRKEQTSLIIGLGVYVSYKSHVSLPLILRIRLQN